MDDILNCQENKACGLYTSILEIDQIVLCILNHHSSDIPYASQLCVTVKQTLEGQL